VPARLPSLLAAPPAAEGRLWLTNARLFAGTEAGVREAAGVLVEDGRIERVGAPSDAVPEGARVIDLDGRVLMPGLVDAHVHVKSDVSAPAPGAEPPWPGTSKHLLAAALREMLRMGLTTVRDVGSYGDDAVELRQAMRYGAFRGPRLLTCGRIVSATSPGGRFFEGMYREADGCDDVRRAVREQLRRGADFIKVMTTGARSVELEDPNPAQLTGEEIATLVQEAHRMGYRVAAHAEGIAGTELAIEHGVDTIEHGMYLHRRPELLERMARSGQILVPTLSSFYGMAGKGDPVAGAGGETRFGAPRAPVETWSPLLVELAEHNLEEAERTLGAARAAGVRIAMGYDWAPLGENAIEIVRMIRHGLTSPEALVAATATAADALGLGRHIGTVEPGKLADLVVVDGNPLEDCELLLRRDRIWLVIQLGQPVAGAALEKEVLAAAPAVTAA
jgi:imidazolonepropionase-like amidohydrolase